MITRHTALVGIELFMVSNNFMYKLSQNRPMPYQIFNVLPKYTINTNVGGGTTVKVPVKIALTSVPSVEEIFQL